jgi:hypothetical protein
MAKHDVNQLDEFLRKKTQKKQHLEISKYQHFKFARREKNLPTSASTRFCAVRVFRGSSSLMSTRASLFRKRLPSDCGMLKVCMRFDG